MESNKINEKLMGFYLCHKTGMKCNIPYKKKDKRCKTCIKQRKEGII